MMEDYIKAGIAFANMYISLAFGMLNQDDVDGKVGGTLIASWFTVLFYHYGTSKLLHTGEVNCIHYELRKYWLVFLGAVLYKTHNPRNPETKLIWNILFFLSHHSIVMNYLITENYDEYNAKLLWENKKIEGIRFFKMFQSFVVTYVLLIRGYRIQVLTLWTLMFVHAMSSLESSKLGLVRMT